jgi:Domain of unknown function (DUF6538)
MLFRLVSPMQRKGTINRQLVKRIPADVRQRAVGTTLAIPIGDSVKRVTITAKMDSIRVSLGTADPSTAKARAAEVLAYLEQVFAAWRADRPVALSCKHSVDFC